MADQRQERLNPSNFGKDYRSPFQRDLDRILYSPEFRRLSGVTQVASATEGDVFHNRLTHSLKVAQVGRRLAERLIKDADTDMTRAVGGIDPDTVEAAGLAHDLGHPPFGHDGEQTICTEMRTTGDRPDQEGFEGNAQTFRIVTRLAAPEGHGLDLTLATLNAILKYPWLSGNLNSCEDESHNKWGAYQSEAEYFRKVREIAPDNQPSLEAQLMEWADDVTYAVHDLDDFYRAGLIPLHQLHTRDGVTPELERFMSTVGEASSSEATDLGNLLERVYHPLNAPFRGMGEQRTVLRAGTSALLTKFINAVSLRGDPPEVAIGPTENSEVKLLKQLTRHYVIGHPRVVSVREGQREILKRLFQIYAEAINGRKERLRALLPQSTMERLDSGDTPQRLTADLLAGMTERQVIQTYQRLTGMALGPVSHFDL